MPFAIWILADDHDGSGISGGHCANYDFELNLRPLASQRIAQEFLGPPAWLCEGGAWPRRLEQRNQGSQVVDPGELQVLRQRRFALRDLFDLTRPPERGEGESAAAAGSLGGLHALEIQVTEPSIFRLTTHAPTVPARPMLVPGHREEAWLALAKPQEFPTRRIPAAGREFRHSISVELAPGDYTLLFVLEMPTGGLRPCASLLVNLLLEPLGAGGSCGSDAGNGILDLQAMAEPVPLSAWRPQPMSFMITLPRPPGTFEEGAGDAQGLQIIARSSMNLGVAAEGNAPPVVLHAKVTSPFSAADLQVTFYENGQPLGEPQPLPDGNGYTAMAGPAKKESFYEVVLFHVPRHHSSRTTCVEFNVELAALSLTPPTVQGQFIAPLPGAETCWQQEQLPNILRVREGEPTLLEGQYQLPSSGSHTIQVVSASHVLLRATVTSADADVRVGQEPLQLIGLTEDHFFHFGPPLSIALRTDVGDADVERVCPTLRLQLVALPQSSAAECQTSGSLQALGRSFTEALVEQPSESASLRRLATLLEPTDEAATVPFRVASVSAELRIELSLEAPWLPLEMVLLREGQQEKAWARAHFTGQRLVMLLPSLPKGHYQLNLGFAPGTSGLVGTRGPCAAVVGTVALLAANGKDTSNYRQEMLDLPELLAVQPPPSQLIPGWFASSTSP
ncbi:Uncharacterized protein SCF082_LOCUS16192, partial [Durusdinium trenchii]